MPIALLIPNYLIWHYSKGLKELFVHWGHLLYFVVHYFSIPNLLMTLLAPWKRMDEGARRTINPGAIMEHVIFNTLMRAVGFLIRVGTIGIGLVVCTGTLIGGLSLITLWLFAPLIVVVLFSAGVVFLVNPTN